MNSLVKVLLVIVCLYVSIAKLYVTIFYIVNERLDAPVQFVDFFCILFLCLFAYINLEKRTKNKI